MLQALVFIFSAIGGLIVDTVIVGGTAFVVACAVGITISEAGSHSSDRYWDRWFTLGMWIGGISGGGFSLYSLLSGTIFTALLSSLGLVVVVAIVATAIVWHIDSRGRGPTYGLPGSSG